LASSKPSKTRVTNESHCAGKSALSLITTKVGMRFSRSKGRPRAVIVAMNQQKTPITEQQDQSRLAPCQNDPWPLLHQKCQQACRTAASTGSRSGRPILELLRPSAPQMRNPIRSNESQCCGTTGFYLPINFSLKSGSKIGT